MEVGWTRVVLCLLVSATTSLPSANVRQEDSERTKRDLSLVHGIYPGTKWCGKGNISSSPTDLGELKDVDKCCRHHDHCPLSITPGETKYGLTNNALYPVSHCGCDDELYNCLKDLKRSNDAQILGEIYFDILGMKCFIKEYPKTCTKWHWWGTCKEHKEQKDQIPIVQLMAPRPY